MGDYGNPKQDSIKNDNDDSKPTLGGSTGQTDDTDGGPKGNADEKKASGAGPTLNRGNAKDPRSRSGSSFSNCWKHDITYTDVVIIGNGPSGICLSYMLSGNWPYYTGNPHPNEYLQLRLQDMIHDKSLLEMDLEYLSSGLEGRSSNPVALLFDNLTHPDADMGLDKESLLQWQQNPQKTIPHVVLGRKAEGGAWQMMEGEMQTLSLGTWMQLPNMPFKDWLSKYRSLRKDLDSDYCLSPIHNRASMDEVCSYYMDYVKQKKLSDHFRSYSTVTSVERVLDVCHTIDDESGEQQPCSNNHNGKVKWEVRGFHVDTNEIGETETVDFCYRAPNVVLATGTFDTPNKLGVSGENHDYVLHSLGELEKVIKEGKVTQDSDPVMVVGAGLSAADAVLCLQNCEIPLEHVFRRDSKDPRIILRQLPSKLYPEYHHVLEMMREGEDAGYHAHATSQISECLEDGKVLVHCNKSGCDTLVKVSYLVVLIGARPNLSFLPDEGKNLGVVPGRNIDSKNNPIDIDAFTYQSIYEAGLYAMGPLVGDNFVRFLRGGALAIASHMVRKREGLL